MDPTKEEALSSRHRHEANRTEIHKLEQAAALVQGLLILRNRGNHLISIINQRISRQLKF